MSTIILTDDNFEEEVLKSPVPVLVDFWAEWCGPCQMIAPILDELSSSDAGVKVGKINVDEHPNAPTEYGIRSIPTLMLFKGGQVVDSKVGVLSKTAINDWIKSHT